MPWFFLYIKFRLCIVAMCRATIYEVIGVLLVHFFICPSPRKGLDGQHGITSGWVQLYGETEKRWLKTRLDGKPADDNNKTLLVVECVLSVLFLVILFFCIITGNCMGAICELQLYGCYMWITAVAIFETLERYLFQFKKKKNLQLFYIMFCMNIEQNSCSVWVQNTLQLILCECSTNFILFCVNAEQTSSCSMWMGAQTFEP